MSLENCIALFINENAGSVTPRLMKQFSEFSNKYGRIHYFPSASLEQATSNAEEILKEGYGAVMPIGGDGTILSLINMFAILAPQMGIRKEELPRFILSKMGTGNALGPLVGATKKWALQVGHTLEYDDLRKAPHINIPMLELRHKAPGVQEFSDPKYFSFAGAGLDGAILNDYNKFKSKFDAPWQKFFATGITGYTLSSLMYTLPRLLGEKTPEKISLLAKGTKAYKVRDGCTSLFREYDELELVDGIDLLSDIDDEIQAVFFGTTPHFGYNLEAFPRAQHAWNYQNGPFMEVRVVTGSIPKLALGLIPRSFLSWKIADDSKFVKSFLVQSAELKYHGEGVSAAYQIGGDAFGDVSSVQAKVSDNLVMPAILHKELDYY